MIGERIKQARRAAGMSQRSLAEQRDPMLLPSLSEKEKHQTRKC